MNDIEAMKRYLEALAVNKRKQQVDAFLAQVSQAALASACLAEGVQPPPAPPRRESATTAASSGIPTKLNNLCINTYDGSSDEEDDTGGNERGGGDPQLRNCRKAAGIIGSDGQGPEGGSSSSHHKLSTTANGGAGHVETLVVTQGPISTRLIHLHVADPSKALLLPPVDKASRIDRETRSQRMLDRLRESGVLTSNDTTPGQLPVTFQPGPHDVVLSGADDFTTVGSHRHGTQGPYRNAEFQKLIFCSVPTYQVAVECQCTQDIKKLVQSIVLTVSSSRQRGHFVAPILVAKASMRNVPPLWCEVSRNIAERFCLRELKIASIAKARVQQMTLGSPVFAAASQQQLSPKRTSSTAPPKQLPQSLKAPPPPPALAAAALQQAHAVQQLQTRMTTTTASAAPPPLPQRGAALAQTSSSMSPFARRVTPLEIALPSPSELELEGGPTSPRPVLDPLALLSEAAFRVDRADRSISSCCIKRKNEYSTAADCVDDGGALEDGPRNKQRRISVG